MDQPIRFRARIQRKQDNLPRYIVVPEEHVLGRTRSFMAYVRLDEKGPIARTIHPWGKGLNVFFFNLTGEQCRAFGLETGDDCDVTISVTCF